MTTYNTGNPIGSTDSRDLYDNAQNLDNFANGTAASYTDRLGVSRRSLSGIDSAADNVLNSIGYAVPVAYSSGISLTMTSQTVDYNGVIYAPKSSALPFTTSSWGTDSAKFRAIQVTDADLITYTPAGTGAVATTVQAKLRETVSVKDFGAVGDGVTDDSAALLTMRDALLDINPSANWQINFSGGNYRFSNNKWLCGIRNITLDLQGGSLTYTSTNTSNIDEVSFFGTPGPYEGITTDTAISLRAMIPALPISTVNAGSTTIAFTQAGKAALFTVGEPIIIGGLNVQDGGYPPNLYYFEHTYVTGVDAGANTISVYPLQNNYASTWPATTAGGFGQTSGPAQVIKLIDRAAIAPAGIAWPDMLQNLTVKNGTIAALQTATNFGCYIAETFIAENVLFDNINVYGLSAKSLIYRNVHIPNAELELDKLVDHAYIENCDIKILSSAVGVRNLVVDSSTIRTRTNIAPKYLSINDSGLGPFTADPRNIATVVSANNAKISNSFLLNSQTNGGDAYITVPDFVAAGTQTPASISGSSVVFNSYPNIAPDTYLMKTDGSVYGKVVDVSGSGPYTLSVRWNGSAPTTGSAFYNFRATTLDVTSQYNQNSRYPGCILDPYAGDITLLSPRESTIVDKFMVYSKITQLTIDVSVAHPGVAYVRGFGGSPTIAVVNTGVAGTRVLTASSATGAQSGDNLSGYTNLANYNPRLRFDFLQTDPDITNRAIYTVNIESQPLVNL